MSRSKVDLHELAPVGGRAACGRDRRRFEWFAQVGEEMTSRGLSNSGLRPLANLRVEVSRLLPAVSSETDVAATRWALELKLLAHPGQEFRPGLCARCRGSGAVHGWRSNRRQGARARPARRPWHRVADATDAAVGVADHREPLQCEERPCTESPQVFETLEIGPVSEEAAQPFRHGDHPLPHRYRRNDVVDEMRSSLCHPATVAGGKDTAAPARGGHDTTLSARNTASQIEQLHENSTHSPFQCRLPGVRMCQRILSLLCEQRRPGFGGWHLIPGHKEHTTHERPIRSIMVEELPLAGLSFIGGSNRSR